MYLVRFAIILLLILFFVPHTALAGNKIAVHGIYMIPYGTDAKDVSRPGWGLGGDFIIGLPGTRDILLGVLGIEYVNLMSNSLDLATDVEGVILPYTKQTDQWYGRLRFGGQIGGLGNGFLRPYLGLNGALVIYSINTDLNFHPSSGEQDFTEHAYDETHAVFGADITLGLDMNVSEHVSVDGGVKYLKSFGVPDQLGGSSVKIYPQYFQVCLGVGISILPADLE